MRRPIWTLFAALSLGACATVPAPVASAPGSSVPLGAGLVSAADPRAAEAGASILRQGGSATDAALATLLALTVVEPQSSGIGGGGFLVTSNAAGTVRTFDGRETAPMAAGGDWFFKDGKPMAGSEAVPGGTSVGVPGNVRMMALAHGEYGRLAWARLFRPAIRLARDGYAVTARMHRFLGEYRATAGFSDAGRGLFYHADGKPKAVGTVIRNPALANYLEQLARLGPDSFYVGPNAQAIASTVNAARRNPSSMTSGDLASYRSEERPAMCGAYRQYRVCGMGPPSSGGIAVLQILKQLERFDLASLGASSPVSWHLIAESTRLAFADRDKYVADPAFVRVPAAGLTEANYLVQRSSLIAADRTMAVVAAGTPAGALVAAVGTAPAEAGTSHFVTADRWGSVASLTSTIEGSFGSGLIVNGYMLNNELTDFSFTAANNGVPVANRVEPGKRPRSSMSPTIVFGLDGRVRLAIGAAGGATIIAQVAKSIIGVLDWNLSAQDAIALPVIFAPGGTVYYERGSSLEAMAPALRALGHVKLEPRQLPLKANAIEWRSGAWHAGVDPRSEGDFASAE